LDRVAPPSSASPRTLGLNALTGIDSFWTEIPTAHITPATAGLNALTGIDSFWTDHNLCSAAGHRSSLNALTGIDSFWTRVLGNAMKRTLVFVLTPLRALIVFGLRRDGPRP